MRRTKYSRKLYELNDCDVRSMLWYKLRTACRLGVPTDMFFGYSLYLSLQVEGSMGSLVLLFPKAPDQSMMTLRDFGYIYSVVLTLSLDI